MDDKFPILSPDCAMEFAISGITLERVNHADEVNARVIDGNNSHFAGIKAALVTRHPNDQIH